MRRHEVGWLKSAEMRDVRERRICSASVALWRGFWKWRLRRRMRDSNPYQSMVATRVQAMRRKATTARLPGMP